MGTTDFSQLLLLFFFICMYVLSHARCSFFSFSSPPLFPARFPFEISHNLVTIPPAGWTDVAHRHGTRVFGTFITEWDAGYEVCAELLSSQETVDRAAERLARIAVDHGFDGWLVNIENKIDPGANIEVGAETFTHMICFST